MSRSHSSLSSLEVFSDFQLYIPNLERAELCVGLFNNNIIDEQVRLIFNSKENMLAMATSNTIKNARNRYNQDGLFTLLRDDSNERAVIIAVNLQDNHKMGPLFELGNLYPKQDDEKSSENIKPVKVSSAFLVNTIKVPALLGSSIHIMPFNGRAVPDEMCFEFTSKETMWHFLDGLKENKYFDRWLVFDRCTSETKVGVRLRLELINAGKTIFNELKDYLINTQTLAFESKNSFKFMASAQATNDSDNTPSEANTMKLPGQSK